MPAALGGALRSRQVLVGGPDGRALARTPLPQMINSMAVPADGEASVEFPLSFPSFIPPQEYYLTIYFILGVDSGYEGKLVFNQVRARVCGRACMGELWNGGEGPAPAARASMRRPARWTMDLPTHSFAHSNANRRSTSWSRTRGLMCS